ncbi:MAG: DNRLRE domain-containing protein [Pseudomonadota bacterium]
MIQNADAATSVRDGDYADTNYGAETQLKAKARSAEFHRRTLIRFDLSNAQTSFDDAILSVTQLTNHANQQIRVFGVTDGNDNWDEHLITFNSATALGLLDSSVAADLGVIDFSPANNGQTVSFASAALTNFLRDGVGDDGLVTLLITSTQTWNIENAVFAAREHGVLGPTLRFTDTDAVSLPIAALMFAPLALLMVSLRIIPVH